MPSGWVEQREGLLSTNPHDVQREATPKNGRVRKSFLAGNLSRAEGIVKIKRNLDLGIDR